ncbi:MAG: transposase [Planctomycetota bacterium]|nr:transposase [Planctomycetota bacterium]MDA1211884.1 transposase [Planctomycetota bacterium]
MGQSFARVWLHITFSTKDRRPYLQDDDFREEMFKMMAHHVQETGCVVVRVGGWIDHVHVVCGLLRTIDIATLVELIKVETSKWAKKDVMGIPMFAWQSGYAAFSVSQSLLPRVEAYVKNQASHHAQRSFQDEFRELCRKHGIDVDERYVWD